MEGTALLPLLGINNELSEQELELFSQGYTSYLMWGRQQIQSLPQDLFSWPGELLLFFNEFPFLYLSYLLYFILVLVC